MRTYIYSHIDATKKGDPSFGKFSFVLTISYNFLYPINIIKRKIFIEKPWGQGVTLSILNPTLLTLKVSFFHVLLLIYF